MRALLLALSIASPSRQEPAEAFTVLVEADPNVSPEVFDQAVRGIRKRKEWLFLTEDPGKAEITVRILAHRVAHDLVVGLGTRVRHRAQREPDDTQAIEIVDVPSLSERHYVVAQVTLSGRSRALIGRDKSTKDARMERAASALAVELEDFLKTGYPRLAEARRHMSEPTSALEKSLGDPEEPYARAVSLEKSGALLWEEPALMEAEKIYRSLAEEKAGFPDLAIRWAHVLFLLDREGEAREVLERARLEEASPSARFAAWVLQGEIARRREDWGLANQAFAAARGMDPTCRPCDVAIEETRERTGGGLGFEVVAFWLASPTLDGPDRWWCFLEGPGEPP